MEIIMLDEDYLYSCYWNKWGTSPVESPVQSLLISTDQIRFNILSPWDSSTVV